MSYPTWMAEAYANAEKKKVDTQPAIAQGTDTREFPIPASPFPGRTLIGVELQGEVIFTHVDDEAPIANRTVMDVAMTDFDLRQTTDNKGTRYQTSGNFQRLHELMFGQPVIQDALPSVQGAGTATANFTAFVPFCGVGACSFKMTTGLLASGYVDLADITALTVSFTLYAVYAPSSFVVGRLCARETNIAAMTQGSITSNMNALEGSTLVGILLNSSAFNSGIGDVLTRMGYSDGQVAYDKDAQVIFAENDTVLGDLVDLPRTAGSFYFSVPERKFERNGSTFINPEYTGSTAMNCVSVQYI
jgi:hypothetical protein